jgi:hypothetical protein
MTAAEVMPTDAWMERCLISVCKASGTEVEFSGLTDSVKFSPGEKGVDQTVLVNGGRVVTFKPEDMGEVTIKGFPIDAGTATGASAAGFFDLKHSGGTTQPLTVTANFTRSKYRVSLLWTTDLPTTTIGSGTPTSGKRAIRIVVADCYCTNVEPDEWNADSPLKATVTFKFAAFDKTAVANYKEESTDGTVTFAPLASYTTTTKW